MAQNAAREPLANIGQTQRKVRLAAGIVTLAVGVAAAAALIAAEDLSPWWRLLLFIPFYQGIRFIYDARTGTCPLSSELGVRNLQAPVSVGGRKIHNPELVASLRSISRKALAKSVVFAAVLTAVAVIVPA